MGAREITAELLGVNLGAIFEAFKPKDLLTHCLEQMATAQKDLDITGDVDSANYYAGLVDAYHDVVGWLAPYKDEVSQKRFLDLIDKRMLSKEELARIMQEAAA